MSEEDKEILNNLISKKEEILEFKEIKAMVKLLLKVDKKLENLMPTEIHIEYPKSIDLMNKFQKNAETIRKQRGKRGNEC